MLDILEGDYLVTENFACWSAEIVPVADIDRYQIIDDPDDQLGWQKTALLQAALRENVTLPPIVLAHSTPDDRGRYGLLDGRHRFNAAHLESVPLIRAWVAHIGCCGGPAADHPAQS
ncbi:ParB N-terminal domain-containing protein [Streptomyces prasinus]|uniref:ParB N-terminal domain-containing protein n=1 Tax=Streptomyces prasinus TaxID=67345 RepID=UPI00363F3399